MAFTDAEKTAIRRYCGFGVFGNTPTQGFGFRFFTWYGTLEFRMNNLQPTEEDVIRTVYLPNLASLEGAIPTTSANLDTAQAAVWTHNANEQRDRENLFNDWCRRLRQFILPDEGVTNAFMLIV